MKLTTHQKRILAALHELHKQHSHRWWGRAAIGVLVQAGGRHDIIQRRTMLKLRELGLVMLERQSWSRDVQRQVHCTCGMHHWGLTQAGAELAIALRVHWGGDRRHGTDLETLLSSAACHDDWRCTGDGDGHGELFVRPKWRDDDDDDDDFQEPLQPGPIVPNSPAAV